MKHFVGIIFLLLFFFSNCSENSRRELHVGEKQSLPTFIQFDYTSKDHFMTLKNKADSFLFLVDSLLTSDLSTGSITLQDSLKLYHFKFLIYSLTNRFDSTISQLPGIFERALSVNDTSFLVSVLGNYNIINNLDYLKSTESRYYDICLAYLDGEMSEEKAVISNSRGQIYYLEQEHIKARQLFTDANEYFRLTDNALGLAMTNISLGNLFYAMKTDESAIRYYKSAITHARIANKIETELSALNNLGGCYKRAGKIDSAILCYQTILETSYVKTKKEDAAIYLPTLFNISNNYADAGEYSVAMEGYLEVEKVSLSKKMMIGLVYSLHGQGRVYFLQGQYEKAIDKFQRMLKLIRDNKFFHLLPAMVEDLEKSYEAIENHKEAYEMIKWQKNLSDSLLNVDKQKVIHELEIKYESDLKQIENDYLASELISKENALQSRNYYLMLVGSHVVGTCLFVLFQN